MKCVVINGTEIKGCTYNLKEIFLDELKPSHLTEFFCPKLHLLIVQDANFAF